MSEPSPPPPSPSRSFEERTNEPIHVLGIDASLSHSALVLGRATFGNLEPEVRSMRIMTELKAHAHEFARLSWLAGQLDARLAIIEEMLGGPGLIVLENYSFGARFNREALAEWGGQIRMRVLERGWRLLTVAVPTLKKFVTNAGHAEKNQMMMEILDRWGYKATDDNNADAYALMRFGVLWEAHRYGYTVSQALAKTLHTPKLYLPC